MIQWKIWQLVSSPTGWAWQLVREEILKTIYYKIPLAAGPN